MKVHEGIQEDGCDMGVHQSYLGTERNTPVIPNWFQLSYGVYLKIRYTRHKSKDTDKKICE